MMKKITLFLIVLFFATAIAQDPPADPFDLFDSEPASLPTAAPVSVITPEAAPAPTAVLEPDPAAIPEAEPVAATPEPILESQPITAPELEPTPVVIPAPAPTPTPAPTSQGKQTIAIYMAGKEPKGAKGVHNILGGELARTISTSAKYIAVDRTEAIQQQLAREHSFQRSGAVDDDQIKSLGQQLGVQYLCISDINPVRGRQSYYLDVRLIDVVTAEIIRTVTANSSLKNANEMKRAAHSIAYELIETESAKWQRERRKKIFFSTAISLDVLGAGFIAYGLIENSNIKKHVDTKTFSEAERAKTSRDAAYVVGGVLLVSGITIHILF